MPHEAKVNLNAQMRTLGHAESAVPALREKLETARDKPGSKELTQRKASQRLSTLEAMHAGGSFVDRPITHSDAAGARVGLVKAGVERSQTEGTDPGHLWYFGHHNKLARVADVTGHDKHAVIAASAVMSPQNNPEQELSAVTALSMAHANPRASITVGDKAVQADPTLRDFQGKAHHPSAFSAEQLANLSSVGVREHVETKGVDLHSIAKGGVKGNVVKAIGVLRGDIHPDEAINPQSSPKVWSYHNNIRSSVWGSAEHEEFARRMGTVGNPDPAQGSMNLFPELSTATHGPLDPHGPTAEDTWQQAISTRQQLGKVEIPGRVGRAHEQSPAKFSVGEGGSASEKQLRATPGLPNVNPPAKMHAWQNQATQLAAGRLSRETGEVIPAIGVQAGGWTEGRRQAGKAIEEDTKVERVASPQQFSMLTPSNRAKRNV